jgi:protein gp37
MKEKSSLETTSKKWNPIVGCSKVSEGCKYCYAESITKWLVGMNNVRYKNGFKLTIHNDLLEQPLEWKKPERIFVCGMTDIFHEEIPDAIIQKLFEVMNKTPQHDYLFTTKRSERMAQMDKDDLLKWSDNIWAGVTVENSKRRYRLDHLVATKAKLKYVMVEPLLGKVDISAWLKDIDWVALGGESGRHARPMEADWVRKVRDDCIEAKVPFYFKQWGGARKKIAGNEIDGRHWFEYPR